MRSDVRAQVSIFIIVSVLILGIVVAFFLVRGDGSVKNLNVDESRINGYVLRCVEKVSKDALEHIGETGGYFIPAKLSSSQKIAYYFYDEKNYTPSIKKIESELGQYIDEMLFFCTKNFVELPYYEVSQGKIKSKASIEDNKVIFNINYPLSVQKEADIFFLENFKAEIPVRLGVIHKVINEIMIEQMKEKNFICSSCVGKTAEDNDLFIFLLSGEDGVTFLIADEKSEINNEAYGFKFVNKYG